MPEMIALCESHLRKLISAASHTDGAMWPSVIDLRTGRPPVEDHVPRRVYRLIGAPRGSTLYWDQPMIVAAYRLSEMNREPLFSQAADHYVDAFLERCVADNGMFQWGNHAYYDVVDRKVVTFQNGYHELRPITPAWDVFWHRAPETTADYIRKMAERHLYDPISGGFNRHDTGTKGHAFLEAGGILCETLAWLYAKTGERDLLETALRVSRYSYGFRHPKTGLVPNEPDMGRWDSKVCTSEIGLWAQCLLRSWRLASCDEFLDMVSNALKPYLKFAFDEESEKFFGQIDVEDGKSVAPQKIGYWPRLHSDPWNTDQWPTHDYPMTVAEASLDLHESLGENLFLDGVRRWAAIAVEECPAKKGSWAYAESYGRCVRFLIRAGLRLKENVYLEHARELAEEAIDQLWEDGMFQGYPDSHVYESVDGVGFLLLALIFAETREEIETGFF